MNDDERLLADLRDAVHGAQRVPPRFVEAGKAAFGWRNVDAELAALTRDSTEHAAAGTRQESAALRGFTFATGEISIEVQVTADALLGQVVPPQPGRIALQSRDGSTVDVPVDEVGWFAIRPLPPRMFRLRLRTAAGVTVLTEWVTR